MLSTTMNAPYGRSHARRIEPVGFGQSSYCPVVLGPASATAFDWQTEPFGPLVEGPACRIDRCHIPQGGFHVSQDAR